jgi:hypothetical protein
MRSSNINPKEKGKKESAFRGSGFCGCKLFDLKFFLTKEIESKNLRNLNGKIFSETRRA